MADRAVLGVDPGKEGALVLLMPGGAASAWPLPVDGAGLAGRQLVGILRECREEAGGSVYACVERAQSFPGMGVAGAFSYGRDYGVILGILDALGWSYQTVPPRVWHRAIVGGAGDDPKARARAVVEARLPDLELLPGRRRKAHEGIVDAACLAMFAQVARAPLE